MRRGVYGLLGTLCLLIAIAHLTGTLKYSEYPKLFVDAFAAPKEQKPQPPVVATNPSTPSSIEVKSPSEPVAKPKPAEPRPTKLESPKPEKINRATLADLPAIQNAPPPSAPLVPKKPPTAPSMQNYRIAAATASGQPIGYFPTGATITFRGKGTIDYGGRGTSGPIGDVTLIMGADAAGGRPKQMYHGAICLLVPPDPSIPGYKPPSEWVPLPWREIGSGVWEAVYVPERDMDLSVLVTDSKYSDNRGWYDLTVEWSPAGGTQ